MKENEQKKITKGGVVVLVLLVSAVIWMFYPSSNSESSIADKEKQKRKDALFELKYQTKNIIKANLKDPDSFEIIDQDVLIMNNPEPLRYYSTWVKYRAKNSFGGFVVAKKCLSFTEDFVNTEIVDCE